jgi:hypothetical protein
MRRLSSFLALGVCALLFAPKEALAQLPHADWGLGIASWDGKLGPYFSGVQPVVVGRSRRPLVDIYGSLLTVTNERSRRPPRGVDYLSWQGRTNTLVQLGFQRHYTLGRCQLAGGYGFQFASQTVGDPQNDDDPTTLARRTQFVPNVALRYTTQKLLFQFGATTAPRPIAGLPGRSFVYVFSIGSFTN